MTSERTWLHLLYCLNVQYSKNRVYLCVSTYITICSRHRFQLDVCYFVSIEFAEALHYRCPVSGHPVNSLVDVVDALFRYNHTLLGWVCGEKGWVGRLPLGTYVRAPSSTLFAHERRVSSMVKSRGK